MLFTSPVASSLCICASVKPQSFILVLAASSTPSDPDAISGKSEDLSRAADAFAIRYSFWAVTISGLYMEKISWPFLTYCPVKFTASFSIRPAYREEIFRMPFSSTAILPTVSTSWEIDSSRAWVVATFARILSRGSSGTVLRDFSVGVIPGVEDILSMPPAPFSVPGPPFSFFTSVMPQMGQSPGLSLII